METDSINSMDIPFAASIQAYRAAAAQRFTAFTSDKTSGNEDVLIKSKLSAQHAPYQRTEIPGLREYLRNAADAHKAFLKAKTQTNPKQTYVAKALGHGEPVEHLHVTLRRERWLRLRAERTHFVRVTHQAPMIDFVIPCGIPRDVLQLAASQFLLRKNRCQTTSPKPKSLENVLGKHLADECIRLLGIREDPGFAIHIKRCQDLVAAGCTVIISRSKKIQAACDNFEYVRRKYAGKPDELYRRKTARKYATWRRKRQEEDRMFRDRELKAEREMKRRRGHDRLLTSRSNGDSSFAPFLYELSNNTYAYSSKITEAPKLRKIMIDKYTGSTVENNPEPDQLQKALQAAETNPLFHTRVMNRFS